MRRHWRKLAYAAFWIVLLVVTFESYVHPEADNKTRAVMFGIILLFAAPISFVPYLIIHGAGQLSPDAGPMITSVLPSGGPAQLLLWWLAMFVLSYWQWFHLVPKLRSKFPGTPET